jgi:hypothetical protein
MNTDNKFVTCHCNSCSGGIEFERELFDPENPAVIECPHCGSETHLYIPNANEVSHITSVQEASAPRKHKQVTIVKGTRIALTPAQRESPIGQELINLLIQISHDGPVTEKGIRQLNDWLEVRADSEILAIDFLLGISRKVLRLGKATREEMCEMQLAIERVLPKNLRPDIVEKRREVWLQDWIHSSDRPKATEAQLDYIRGLGGTPPPGLNVPEASELIERLLKNHTPSTNQFATEKQLKYIHDLGGDIPPRLTKSAAATLIQELVGHGIQPTPRQIMILRFWNRMDLATGSKNEITEWQERFYAENPGRKEAWELYKRRNKDDGTQRDPSWVKIGEGENCLREIRAIQKKIGLIILTVTAFILIAVIVTVIVYFSKN